MEGTSSFFRKIVRWGDGLRLFKPIHTKIASAISTARVRPNLCLGGERTNTIQFIILDSSERKQRYFSECPKSRYSTHNWLINWIFGPSPFCFSIWSKLQITISNKANIHYLFGRTHFVSKFYILGNRMKWKGALLIWLLPIDHILRAFSM